MGKIKIIFLAFVLLTWTFAVYPDLANALTTSQIDVEIVGGKSLVKQHIETDLSVPLELELPLQAKILDISEKNYSFSGGFLRVNLNKELDLEYLTEEFIDRNGKSYFIANFKMPLKVDFFKLALILPEGASLDSPQSAYPSPEIKSDGVRITLSWGKDNLKAKESFSTFVIFKERKQFPWAIFSFILLLFVLSIAAFLVYLRIKRKASKRNIKSSSKVKPPIKNRSIKEMHLLESESAIFNSLKKSGGEMWQKQIQIATGFSKAKLSRVIRNLEVRGLIKKIPLGNTNKIRLK